MIELMLPADFRRNDFLRFNGRDPQAVAEQVTDLRLRKGIVWDGTPVAVEFSFAEHRVHVAGDMDGAELMALARHMLGLAQPVEKFQRTFMSSLLAAVIESQSGLRISLAATPFEALTFAITSQQISLKAAVAFRRKLIRAAGVRLDDGLYCYPDAVRLSAVSVARLTELGFSRSKAQTLTTVSRAVAEGELNFTEDRHEDLERKLLSIPGIGPWTVNYTLMRGLGLLDGSLHGDAGVRRGIQQLLGMDQAVDLNFAETWLQPFSPWRALAAAHLWAWQT